MLLGPLFSVKVLVFIDHFKYTIEFQIITDI